MKYITKKWIEKKSDKPRFTTHLEILDENKNNLEEIFQREYKKACKEQIKSKSMMIQNEEMFKKYFDAWVRNVKEFFSPETLDKITDIRLLALNIVFKDEYDLVIEEVLRKDAISAYEKHFEEIKDKLPKNILKNLCLHDTLITNIIEKDNKLIVEVDTSASFSNAKRIIFEDYQILKIEKHIINGWCIDEEIYIVDDRYELHLLIDRLGKKDCRWRYFTVRAKNIIFEE